MQKKSKNNPLHFIIATCIAYPKGNADLQNLKTILESFGFSVSLQIWQQINPTSLSKTDIILPLAIWDYMEHYEDFLSFLKEIEHSFCLMLNSPQIIKWNLSKSYLSELSKYDIPIIPSIILEPSQSDIWDNIIAREHLDNPVIKPLVGQSGKGVTRLEECCLNLSNYPSGAMVQPFMDSVFQKGEICLLFFGGEFQYAIHRIPPPKQWRANSEYGAVTKIFHNPPKIWIDTALQILKITPSLPIYARIDILPQKLDKFFINEVELIEPALYFSHYKHSIESFIEKLLKSL